MLPDTHNKMRTFANLRLLISPASKQILLQAMVDGLIATLVESGAMIANRNFQGRVGSADSLIYLASPAVAAASALHGKITDPRRIKA